MTDGDDRSGAVSADGDQGGGRAGAHEAVAQGGPRGSAEVWGMGDSLPGRQPPCRCPIVMMWLWWWLWLLLLLLLFRIELSELINLDEVVSAINQSLTHPRAHPARSYAQRSTRSTYSWRNYFLPFLLEFAHPLSLEPILSSIHHSSIHHSSIHHSSIHYSSIIIRPFVLSSIRPTDTTGWRGTTSRPSPRRSTGSSFRRWRRSAPSARATRC